MIGALTSSWLDVRSRPIRTIAAIAGMVAAVCAVIVVDAAAVLSRNANAEFISSQYGRPATISVTRGDGPDMTRSESDQAASQLQAVLESNGVARVSSIRESSIVAFLGDASVIMNATWVSSPFPLVSYVDLIAGSTPTSPATSTTAHAVISKDFAERLGFDGTNAIGSSLWYAFSDYLVDARSTTMYPLVIDGVAESMGTTSQAIDLAIVSDVPRPEFGGHAASRWLVQVNPVDAGLVVDLVKSIKAGSAGRSAYSARRVDANEDLAPLLNQQRVTARAVSFVAIIVGGLGIFSVGLSSVRERGKEFGLRRALGASKRRIFFGVIVQTLIEALLAAVIAIPLAAIVVQLFARRLVLSSLPLPSSTGLPVVSAVQGVVVAIVVGLVAGLLPAFRAARASVVLALRD